MCSVARLLFYLSTFAGDKFLIFLLIHFIMQQKIYEHHFKVGENGTIEDLNLDSLVQEAKNEGFTVKQISTCYSNKYYPSNKDYDSYIHIFLLAEKP